MSTGSPPSLSPSSLPPPLPVSSFVLVLCFLRSFPDQRASSQAILNRFQVADSSFQLFYVGFHFDVCFGLFSERAREEGKQQFLREIELMKEIGFHRNIMSMHGYWVRSEPIMLILEYVPHGDLLQWLRNKRNQVRICFAFVFLRKSGDSFAFSSLIDGGINNCPTDEILWLLHKCCPCVVSWPSESLSTAFQHGIFIFSHVSKIKHCTIQDYFVIKTGNRLFSSTMHASKSLQVLNHHTIHTRTYPKNSSSVVAVI